MTGVKANPRSGAALRLLEVTVRGTVIVVLTAICSPPGRVHFLFRPVTKGTGVENRQNVWDENGPRCLAENGTPEACLSFTLS